jgi:hypothetical protein
MGELLNRGLQLEILNHFAGEYPSRASAAPIYQLTASNLIDVNASYLMEHELLDLHRKPDPR